MGGLELGAFDAVGDVQPGGNPEGHADRCRVLARQGEEAHVVDVVRRGLCQVPGGEREHRIVRGRSRPDGRHTVDERRRRKVLVQQVGLVDLLQVLEPAQRSRRGGVLGLVVRVVVRERGVRDLNVVVVGEHEELRRPRVPVRLLHGSGGPQPRRSPRCSP